MSQFEYECRCCSKPFRLPGQLARHINDVGLSIDQTVEYRAELKDVGVQPCLGCRRWFTTRGMPRHKNCCEGLSRVDREAVDDSSDESGTQDDSEDDVEIISAENRRFLRELEWEELIVCPYQTLVIPASMRSVWLSTFDMTEALNEAGEIELAFKLQALQIRLITYPSQGVDKEISLRALLKKRVNRFKTGVWEDIWQEQAKIKVKESDRVMEVEAGKLDQKTVKRARQLAKELELSKARKLLVGSRPADPTKDPVVMETLKKLHSPETVLRDFLEEPDGYKTEDKYRFEVKDVDSHSGGTRVKEGADKVVLRKLKKKVAQAASGSRYEHYMGLEESHPKLVRSWIHMIANDEMPSELAEDYVRAAKLFAFYKDEKCDAKKIRPCAIGETLRRITAKVMVLQDSPLLKPEFLKVSQFGIGTHGGIEYAYHAVRLHLDALIDGETGGDKTRDTLHGIMQSDMTNAFNSTDRATREGIELSPGSN